MEQLALFAEIDEKYVRTIVVRELKKYKALKIQGKIPLHYNGKQVKSSMNCSHYSDHKQLDRLNEDKTITKGIFFIQSCIMMDAELTDIRPCEMYERTFYRQSSGHAVIIALKKIEKR